MSVKLIIQALDFHEQTTMNNNLSISKRDVHFLKIVFKTCGIFGIFPLETKSFLRKMHLIFYLIFNLIGIICKPIGLIKLSEKLEMETQEIALLAPTCGAFILLNIWCFYGIYKKNESWIKFFIILDKLSIGFITKSKPMQDTFKIIYFLFLTIFFLILQFQALVKVALTLIQVMGFFLWISTFINSFGVTVVIWLISKILSTRYAHVCNLIETSFRMKRFETTIFSNKLVKIKRSLYVLHKAIILLNNLIGQILFAVFLATFSYLITVFNNVIFIFKSDRSSEFLDVFIPSVLQSLLLTVS